jgi:hypothetical protein
MELPSYGPLYYKPQHHPIQFTAPRHAAVSQEVSAAYSSTHIPVDDDEEQFGEAYNNAKRRRLDAEEEEQEAQSLLHKMKDALFKYKGKCANCLLTKNKSVRYHDLVKSCPDFRTHVQPYLEFRKKCRINGACPYCLIPSMDEKLHGRFEKRTKGSAQPPPRCEYPDLVGVVGYALFTEEAWKKEMEAFCQQTFEDIESYQAFLTEARDDGCSNLMYLFTWFTDSIFDWNKVCAEKPKAPPPFGRISTSSASRTPVPVGRTLTTTSASKPSLNIASKIYKGWRKVSSMELYRHLTH